MLESFLDTKPLFYDVIDYGRMPRIYAAIASKLKLPKIIHIVGTNGKGTTGRFLASALYSIGFSVGHYTSPHIVDFNERIWLNGENIDAKSLDKAHEKLLPLLTQEDANALSYFEYTTLLALYIYQDVEYLVLEAGLGGEYDATAVLPNILTLITPIDKDHETFLGTSIEAIARTKLNAVQKRAIIAQQKHKDVCKVVVDVELEKSVSIEYFDSFLEEDDMRKIALISQNNKLVSYLEENLKLAIAALKYLNIAYEVQNFNESRLFGRLTAFRDNILLDVGHNTLAATAIYQSLKGLRYTLIYNSYKDKNYKDILHVLKPIICDVEIIAVKDARIQSQEILEQVLDDLHIKYKNFSQIKKEKKYLVFGSFSVIEAFLKVFNE